MGVRGILCLLLGVITLPLLSSTHNIPPIFEKGSSCDIRCPPNALNFFSEYFM